MAGLVTLWGWRSWQTKTPGGDSCHLLASSFDRLRITAGERIRTADVQLGKLAFYH
jgi:hypothetical protein